MLKRYGEKALEESAARVDELAADGRSRRRGDRRRITDAVGQLANTTHPGPCTNPASRSDPINHHTASGTIEPALLSTPSPIRSGLFLITDLIEIRAVGWRPLSGRNHSGDRKLDVRAICPVIVRRSSERGRRRVVKSRVLAATIATGRRGCRSDGCGLKLAGHFAENRGQIRADAAENANGDDRDQCGN